MTPLPEPGGQKKRTEILYGTEDAVGQGVRFMQNTKKKMDIYFDKSGPSIVIEVEAYRKGYKDIRRRGGRIRALTEITLGNIHYCKKLMKLVDELYHVEGLKGGVAVNEGEYMSTTVLEEGRPLTQVIYSNVKALTEQAQYIFDTLLNNSVPAEQRIRELEEGIIPEVIETIRGSDRTQKLAFDLITSARREILIIFSTVNAFHRQERAGTVPLVKDLAERNNLRVKIMTPIDDRIKAFAEKEHVQGKKQGILLRHLEPSLQGVSILIVDRKYSLAVELKDDSKESTLDAIGLATYSNSKATVLSYVSIFDSLWAQNELYERLKTHDKMQQDFINMAAHELRTPIQPIIGLSDILRLSTTDKRQHELIDVITRNAKRLQQLSEDVLDVTRIESNSLKLKRERFSLNGAINGAMQDAKNFAFDKGKIQLAFQPGSDVFVTGDKERIAQVICNLLSNAIKFTLEGAVSVATKKSNDGQFAIVSVRDDGCGIHDSIFPRMFEKFATRSEKGIGLGLFISKSIVEAHGGKIWAENNKDGNGATVAFSLPLAN